MASISAIENSRMWLATAEAALAKGIYTTAIYGAEMSVEIALKGVLLALRIDIPKTHNIIPLVKENLRENHGRLPKEFLDKEYYVVHTLEMLLDLRPMVGYAYERNMDEEDIRSKAKEYIKMSGEVVALCDKAIKHIAKKA